MSLSWLAPEIDKARVPMVTLIDISDANLGKGPFDPAEAKAQGVTYYLHPGEVEEIGAGQPVFICMADHDRCPLVPARDSAGHGIVLAIDVMDPSHQAIARWHRTVTRPEVPVVVIDLDDLTRDPPSTKHRARRGKYQWLRRVPTAALVMALSLGPALTASAVGATVSITSTLTPVTVEVPVGGQVTWINNDGERHRVRSEDGAVEFDSGNLEPDDTFTFTFQTAGTYHYVDDRDSSNQAYWGTVVVGGTAEEDPNPDAPNEVRMAGRVFKPGSISINTGDTVTWINDDDRAHTATAGGGSFDSGVMNSGGRWSYTFSAAGTYSYFCAIHPDMTGSVVVGGGGTPPPTTTPPPPPPPPATGDVEIVDFAFSPTQIEVGTGATVTWANNGAALHTVTDQSGAFDSGLISVGGTYSRTFNSPATYTYFCSLHPDMTATLVVTDGSEPPPPPVPPPPPPPPPVDSDVVIADFSFSPSIIEVPVGTTVEWANQGSALHTVTARDGSFDSGLMGTGKTFAHRFDQAGTFLYICSLHPEMTGTVMVPGVDGETPPPEPATTTTPAVPESGDVEIIDFGYSPRSLTVAVGATVRWVNTGAAPHTVTANDGSFDSGFLNTGDRFAHRFSTPGTFQYFCSLHPQMTATVVVPSSSGAILPPAETASMAPVAAKPEEIKMLDFSFSPDEVAVAAGTKVTWVNAGSALHTVTARDQSFDSGFKAAGERFAFTFDTPGTYDYFCVIHPQMTGSIAVASATGAVPPAADTPVPDQATDPAQGQVSIIDLDYNPSAITVTPGTTVTWINTGLAPHTVTAKDQSWTSELLNSGDTFSRAFPEVGVFDYFCTLHPNMVGTVKVADETSSQGPALLASDRSPGSKVGYVVAAVLAMFTLAAAVGPFVVVRRAAISAAGSPRGA